VYLDIVVNQQSGLVGLRFHGLSIGEFPVFQKQCLPDSISVLGRAEMAIHNGFEAHRRKLDF
jgi:hypothetical protein